MVLFFYGADAYRSHQKLLELKTRYVDASLGDTNLSHLEAKSLDPDALASQLLAYPFLAKTRLVILDRLVSEGSKAVGERFVDLLGSFDSADAPLRTTSRIPDTTVAVVYEPAVPDRRTVLFKRLVKDAKATEFKPLQGRELAAWIDRELQLFGVEIEPAARDRLATLTAGNTWQLASELGKLRDAVLSLPEGSRTISPALVADLVTAAPDESIFALTDALAAGQADRALGTLRQLLEQGENAQYLLAMVASTLRTGAIVRDAMDRGSHSPAAIASATKLSPFVVGKHLGLAKRWALADSAVAMRSLSELDLGTKTGRIEAETGLELFIVEACQDHQFQMSKSK